MYAHPGGEGGGGGGDECAQRVASSWKIAIVAYSGSSPGLGTQV